MPAINDIAARARYTATANQTVFTVPFEFLAVEDLKVYVDAILQNPNSYAVTGADTTGGGTITFAAGVPAGAEVVIISDTPIRRLSDFPSAGAFQVSQLEAELDRLTVISRELETRINRSLRLSDADLPETFSSLPARSTRAGKYLYFDNDGNPVANTPAALEITAGFMLKSAYDSDNDGIVDAAEVANSVAWANVTGRPATFPATAHTHVIADVTGLQTALDGKAAASHVHTIANVTGLQAAIDGKAAASHTHLSSDISDFGESVDDRVASLLTAGYNTALSYNDATNTLQISFVAGAGAGADGMSKAIYDTNNNGKVDLADYADAAPWAGITGKPATFSPAAHTHAISDVTNLQTTLNGKADSGHTHTVSALTDFATGTRNLSALTLSTGDLLYASASNTLARLGVGTNGHVLTLSGGLPVWAAPGAASAVSERIIVYTAGGDYTPSAGVKSIEFTLIGGGGGSGASYSNTTTPKAWATGGGGSGAFLRFILAGSDIINSGVMRQFRIAIGVGGAGGVSTASNGNSAAGGNTTLAYTATPTAIFATAGGGAGSLGSIEQANRAGGAGGTASFSAPVSASNVMSIPGRTGKQGRSVYAGNAANAGLALGGDGGDSMIGSGGIAISTVGSTTGNFFENGVSPTAGQYGGGAAGSSVLRKSTSGTLAAQGAAGANGVCIIREIYG